MLNDVGIFGFLGLKFFLVWGVSVRGFMSSEFQGLGSLRSTRNAISPSQFGFHRGLEEWVNWGWIQKVFIFQSVQGATLFSLPSVSTSM